MQLPNFDLATEASAGSDIAKAATGGAYVVAAELVSIGDGLLERKGSVGSAVDSQGGGTAS